MTTPACVHWWILPTPSGRWSEGVCRECGERKQFRNSDTERTKAKFTLGAIDPKPVRREVRP